MNSFLVYLFVISPAPPPDVFMETTSKSKPSNAGGPDAVKYVIVAGFLS